jgi:penicillin amidase
VRPEPWTAETLVLRAGTFGDATAELTLARNVARLGSEEANRQRAPDPFELLVVPDGLDVSIIDDAVSTGGRGGGRGGGVPELVEPYRSWARGGSPPAAVALAEGGGVLPRGAAEGEPGSNNWVVSGRLSATGSPVVVNDPHRDVTNPSLRYISHLVAPGWNVIGASEPPFVGVHIGHNDRLGWGLTIVGTDQEDVYVEALNPADPGLVRWRDGWEPLRRVREEIRVKGQAPVVVDLQFSRHGPIFHVDGAGHRAYALRSASMEPGTAPYLAGLRLAQARDCRMFLSEAMYWKAPSENLICGDRDGHISWQASALTPKRGRDGRLWSGRLPVPGTGGYEWDGFRSDLPREIDPPRGFVATANHNIHPPGYGPPIMFKTSTSVPFDRITRLLELLDPGRQFTIDDHRTMQLDALSLRARAELSLFRGWVSADARVERARAALAAWDAVLSRESLAAALHSTWRDLASPAERDVARPIVERQRLHEGSLARAVERLTATQGADWAAWRWGRMHTRALPHALVAAYSLPTIERRGGAGTLAADGASFREILDVADWDRSIVTNVPGQSGQPGSPFYDNLLRLFESDEYFPLVYTRSRVERETTHRLRLGSDLELQHRAK